MVRLTKIYTRTGDDGTTGLASGTRVRKDDARVEAYGDVDEANAAIGLAASHAPVDLAWRDVLRDLQQDLFDLGADLATPVVAGERDRLRIVPEQVSRLERLIDEHNERLRPLTSFVLPGGSHFAAGLHLARTVVRRAERRAVTLMGAAPGAVNAHAVTYLNRLSDLLFVLARVANDYGGNDVLWTPGATRGK
jgi:cob(I)alamin adenosyltransferase